MKHLTRLPAALALFTTMLLLTGCADLVTFLAGTTPPPVTPTPATPTRATPTPASPEASASPDASVSPTPATPTPATPTPNPYAYIDSISDPFGEMWISSFGNGTVTVSWDASIGCTSYVMQKAQPSASPITRAILPTTARSYTFTGIDPFSDNYTFFYAKAVFPSLPNPSASPPRFSFWGGCAQNPGSGSYLPPPVLSQNQFFPKNGYAATATATYTTGNLFWGVSESPEGPYRYKMLDNIMVPTRTSNQTRYFKALVFNHSGASQWSNVLEVTTGSPAIIPALDSGILSGTYLNSQNLFITFNANGTFSEGRNGVAESSGTYTFSNGALIKNFSSGTSQSVFTIVTADTEYLVLYACKKTSTEGDSTMDGIYFTESTQTSGTTPVTTTITSHFSMAANLSAIGSFFSVYDSLTQPLSFSPQIMKWYHLFKTATDYYIGFMPTQIYRKQ